MAKLPNQKLKLLYIKDYLEKSTDEDHRVTVKDMIIYLENLGIHADRKTIYADLEELINYGVDIIRVKGKATEYYVGGRDFELSELRVLIDAVATSRFLTPGKTKRLTDKIMNLCSVHEKKWLEGQLYIPSSHKSTNEHIYHTVFAVHKAIYEGKQIAFTYWKYVGKGEKILKNQGRQYVVMPYLLTWNDSNYYLVAQEERGEKLKTFRVDKIYRIEILDRDISLHIDAQSLIKFVDEQFSMFDGDAANVTIEFDDELIGVVLDKFGAEAALISLGNGRTKLLCQVKTSVWFYSWLLGLGGKAKISQPKEVVDEFCECLKAVLTEYTHIE